jgi:hypothetical protein
VVTPAARREAAAYLRRAFEMSERRACRVIGSDRTSVRYQGVRPDDGGLRERLKALAQERRRFGYRRLHVLLRREGHAVNKKRVQRLYREERLTVRRRGGRKRAIGTRRPMVTPLAADQRWSLDFVSDQLTDGRRFRILAVVDDCTRELRSGLVQSGAFLGRAWEEPSLPRRLPKQFNRHLPEPKRRRPALNEPWRSSLGMPLGRVPRKSSSGVPSIPPERCTRRHGPHPCRSPDRPALRSRGGV